MGGSATAAPKDRPLSRKELENFRVVVEFHRNGLRYRVTAGFRALSPAYDLEQTAAALEEGLADLFEKCKQYKRALYSGRRTPVQGDDFGDEQNGNITVTFAGEVEK
ncbi:hypothetical protein Esti_002066 [Eimeria stiedai]